MHVDNSRDAVAARQGRLAARELTAMETYKSKKIVTKYACCCSAIMLTSKIIP